MSKYVIVRCPKCERDSRVLEQRQIPVNRMGAGEINIPFEYKRICLNGHVFWARPSDNDKWSVSNSAQSVKVI